MPMNVSSNKKPIGLEIMTGPRLKLAHARKHLALLKEMADHLPNDMYSIESRNIGGTRYALIYSAKRPIGHELSLIIGDIAHNLRSALDHLATAILRHADSEAEPHFPVPTQKMSEKKKKTIGDIEKLLPGVGLLLTAAFGNEQTPPDRLWGFAQIDNDDKHNLIIPTVVAASVDGLYGTAGANSFSNLSIGFNANFENQSMIESGSPIILHGTPSLKVSVFLGAATPFPHEDAISVLNSAASLVDNILIAVEGIILLSQKSSSGAPLHEAS